jgi:RNA polymerase sigma factor (sigma-70 family)
MAQRKGPSRRSLRARLKALSRELRQRGLRGKLPGEVPRQDAEIDRLARKLLGLYHEHALEAAFDLLFDLAGPLVAQVVTERLAGAPAIEPEEVIARVFLALGKHDGKHEGKDEAPGRAARTFRETVSLLADRVIVEERRRHRPLRREMTALDELLEAAGLPASPPSAPVAPSLSNPTFDLAPDEMETIVARNFDSLPELTQRCFHLHLVEGLSLPDVAQQLGLSLSAVSQRMSDARRQAFLTAREYRRRKEAPDDAEGEMGEEGVS